MFRISRGGPVIPISTAPLYKELLLFFFSFKKDNNAVVVGTVDMWITLVFFDQVLRLFGLVGRHAGIADSLSRPSKSVDSLGMNWG
jgi:hypothetical protein